MSDAAVRAFGAALEDPAITLPRGHRVLDIQKIADLWYHVTVSIGGVKHAFYYEPAQPLHTARLNVIQEDVIRACVRAGNRAPFYTSTLKVLAVDAHGTATVQVVSTGETAIVSMEA